jgi:hypothetical protein
MSAAERMRRRVMDVEGLLDDVIGDYVDMVNPASVAEVKAMEERFHEHGLSHLIGSLDNTLVAEEGTDEYFCCDSYLDFVYKNEGRVRQILDASGCVTAQDVVEWIEKEWLKETNPQ